MDDVHKIVTDRQFAPPRIGLDVKGYLQQNLRGRTEEVQEKVGGRLEAQTRACIHKNVEGCISFWIPCVTSVPALTP